MIISYMELYDAVFARIKQPFLFGSVNNLERDLIGLSE